MSTSRSTTGGSLPPALWSALRRGRREVAVEVLLATPTGTRQRLRSAVRAHQQHVSTQPIGARSAAGLWSGRLHRGHWSAAAAAVLGCSSLPQAVTYAPLDLPDAHDLPRTFFPDELDAFVEEWSSRFLRNPKAWDHIRGLEAMYDWAHQGFVPAPTQPGAVLFLATRGPGARSGTHLLRYLEARPCLLQATFARLFDVDGVNGASLAQRDETTPWPNRRIDNHVIPELVRRNHWTREMVLDGIDRALSRSQTPYQQRWFRGLEEIMRRKT